MRHRLVALAITLFALLPLASAVALDGKSAETGFEGLAAGPLTSITTEVGTFTAVEGPSLVESGHARTGNRCLQLAGPKSVVDLELSKDVDPDGVLTFHAERWTSRGPFSFRIVASDGSGWTPLYDGTREVVVGRSYKSSVRIPLAGVETETLRFVVESPANTGVLIDDLRIAPPQPQKIVAVEPIDENLPVLVRRDSSPLARVAVTVEGELEPISVTEVRVGLDGTTDRGDLESLLLRIGADWDDPNARTVAEVPVPAAGAVFLKVPDGADGADLVEGRNDVWVGCRLVEDADIDHRIGVELRGLALSDGSRREIEMAPAERRLGVAVRMGGEDDIHTYRIPGLATTNAGTLIGVYDNRKSGGYDLPGAIDVGMSRSTDGGRTWEPMRVIMDMGDDPKWRGDGIGDPSVLVDRETGTIWVAALWSHGNRGWNGSGPGMTPEETGQFMLVRSDDDGITWSDPINITEQVKTPEWALMLQGPGKGITMADGTLVFPAQFRSSPETSKVPHSTIIWSKDHGRTWHAGTGAFPHTTESQVVEIEPGVLMLNCRYDKAGVRVVMITRDLGKTWEPHPTSRRSLIEPGACMASLIQVDRELDRSWGEPGDQPGNGRVLFSNPDSPAGRMRMMIKASTDDGLTWPEVRRVLLDTGRSAGYSCMTMIDDETVGILYEGSEAHMTFQRVPLADLFGPAKEEGREDGQADGEANAADADEATPLRLGLGISSGMVLQCDRPIVIHGTGTPDRMVEVELAGDRRRAKVESGGRWQARFRPLDVSRTPITLTVESGDERIACDDILVGEVWICAGQSNMEWPVRRCTNASAAIEGAMPDGVRMLDLQPGAWTGSKPYEADQIARLAPDRYFAGAWTRATPESVADVSAVGWWFALALHEALGVPVGIVDVAVGGTPTEAWIAREDLAADADFAALVAGSWLDNPRLTEFCTRRGNENLTASMRAGRSIPGDIEGPNHPFKPGFMWSAIEPLQPIAARGVLWYQGESNAETLDRAIENRPLMALLIDSWRARFDQRDLPFLFVQLPAMDRPAWPAFRESQRRLLDDRDDLAMAVTIDTGDRNDVHPALKRPVGERLAALAVAGPYRVRGAAAATGPVLDRANATRGEMRITFDHVGRGLATSDGGPVRHLELAGDDGVWHPATGEIQGGRMLRVASPAVPEPRFVRYAWTPYPDPPVNLVDGDGLPASPFTTAPDFGDGV